MAWWGKLLGGAFGFMLGGPLGAILGAALGHNFDSGLSNMKVLPPGGRPSGQERTQTAFFTATFAVMGHVAKADGRVSQEEIQMAASVMDQMGLSTDQKRLAQRLFNEGKSDDFPLLEVLDQFRNEFSRGRNLIRMFVEIQVYAAYADGRMHPGEKQVLQIICEHLGFSTQELAHIESRVSAELSHGGWGSNKSGILSNDEAYAILGVRADTPGKDVTRAYRRLMSQHHPDKLVAKGLPEEMMQVAKEKTQKIKAAYDLIKQVRGL